MRPIVTVTVATCSVSGVKLCIYPHKFEGIELIQIVRPKFIGYAIGADFRFEVPGQSSVGLIGGGRGQWLRSTSL